MTSPDPAAPLKRSHNASDTARNERQKAVLLSVLAQERDETATKLCAQSRRLIDASEARCARARKAFAAPRATSA